MGAVALFSTGLLVVVADGVVDWTGAFFASFFASCCFGAGADLEADVGRSTLASTGYLEETKIGEIRK